MEKHFRERVLDMSLTIENLLSLILFMQFRLTKEESKTLSYRSSALSFKNKADLLHDLNRISDQTYKSLIIFMEIRNQFIHNLSSSNIIIAADRVGKLNYLKGLSEQAKVAYEKDFPETLKISGLELSFMNLYGEILNDLSKFSDEFQKEIDEEIELKTSKKLLKSTKDILKIYTDSVDHVSDKLDDLLENKVSEDEKLNIKDLIFGHFLREVNKYMKEKNLNGS